MIGPMVSTGEETYQRVLVPLDGSLPATSALHVGERLAARWGAELEVVTLIERSQIPSGVHHIIRRQVARINTKPKVQVRSLSYSVADDIAEEFDAVDGTFVVMSSWARGRTAGLVSNVAEDVFRLVRQPMLLTGPDVELDGEWPSGPLYITVDGSDFSEAVVTSAARWAVSIGAEVRLLTVIDPADVPAGINPVMESNELAGLAKELAPIVGGDVNYDVLHGSDPAEEIVDYARRYDASALAMSTHVRSGMSRLAHGSVTMDVVSHASCPVLIDRPTVDDHR